MNYVKHIVAILIAEYSTSGLQAQSDINRIWNEIDSINLYANNSKLEEAVHFNRWSHSATVGTSYSFAPGYGSAMNMYAAPHANFSASDRLSFQGGFLASYTAPMTSYSDSEIGYSQGFSNMSVFVAASYRVTENLIIHGTGVKSLMVFPGDLENTNYNFDDLSIGATYNFGNFSIGASFHRPQRSFVGNPFGFGNSMYGSPLYW
ncbi:MAG: hypothetical protein PF450_00380 [Bacteroidales bacterium]|jgi:hypothetical protein|nr:hypothetical protein [Bacteroidales bacterium]